MSVLTPEQVQQVNFNLGPWVFDLFILVGSCLDLLLQGVLLSQFMNYYTWCTDERGLRIAVAGLAVLTILKSIQSLQAGNPLMVGIIGLYVQCFFCFRLRVISKTWYVAAPILSLFLLAFLSSFVATYYITTAENSPIKIWFAVHLSTVFVGDVVLFCTTAFFLLKSKQNVLPQTVNLINALIRLTFQTAAPAALCACFNLIFSQVTVTSGPSLVSTAFNMPLPKLYAISMMWTLNARQTFSANHSDSMTYTTIEFSAGQSPVQRRSNGDLQLGAIEALTQRGTHFDIEIGPKLSSRQTFVQKTHSNYGHDTERHSQARPSSALQAIPSTPGFEKLIGPLYSLSMIAAQLSVPSAMAPWADRCGDSVQTRNAGKFGLAVAVQWLDHGAVVQLSNVARSVMAQQKVWISGEKRIKYSVTHFPGSIKIGAAQ
ncbi:hypothetical protein DFH06DRAFT_1303074 [Mycena polygramma]|nr:hypothetical protein DFH06DRAFT_1303074 [Mycena polygramma]